MDELKNLVFQLEGYGMTKNWIVTRANYCGEADGRPMWELTVVKGEPKKPEQKPEDQEGANA